MIRALFDGRELARAMGCIGPVMGPAAVTGPALGGVLTQADLLGSTWRAVFLVNVPLGAAVLLAIRLLREDRAAGRPRLELPRGYTRSPTAHPGQPPMPGHTHTQHHPLERPLNCPARRRAAGSATHDVTVAELTPAKRPRPAYASRCVSGSSCTRLLSTGTCMMPYSRPKRFASADEPAIPCSHSPYATDSICSRVRYSNHRPAP